MPSGVVLVIEDDEWVGRLLSTAVHEAGYEVVLCDTAEAGLSSACASEPECIVCDIDLPDHDGYWVARNLRTHPSRASVTPFLFLSALDDQESRLEGFHVGADVYMTKPFRVTEVVGQIGALVQMASRLRQRRDSLLSIPAAAEQTAIEGDLSQMSIATVLTVLEMERRSGVFEVSSKKRRAQLDIASGCILHGTVGGTRVSALAALRTMLTWKLGRFAFTPGPRSEPTEKKSIAAYLLEATRLEDESARAELQLPPSRRRSEPRISTTALGGPASTPDDVAPPSSRAPTQRRPRRGASVVPSKAEGAASISNAPESIELIWDLDSAPSSSPAVEPPTLRSLARMMKPPSSRRGAALEPSEAPRSQGRPSTPRPPRRPTVPPPPMALDKPGGAQDPDAPSRSAIKPPLPPPALRSPGSGPQPPRPAPAQPPRPDTTKKR
jgi:two-component system, OmpR family, response regulator